MREVIISKGKGTVPLSEVDIRKIYACNSVEKGVLIIKKTSFDSDGYEAIVVEDFTRANSPDLTICIKTLERTIKAAIEDFGKVYEFDNFKEFCEWYLQEN